MAYLLLNILQRFPNQNMSDMQRDELLKLFLVYATPKARRTTLNSDVEMKPIELNVSRENSQKRSRHQAITAPTVETVTNACKRIRLINTERVCSQKRQCEPSPMVSSD